MFLTESSDIFDGVESTNDDLTTTLVEAEIAYGNIVRRMMALEHKAIVTEDADLLSEAVKDWYETVKAWLVKLWNNIVAFFKKVYEKVRSMVQTDKSYAARAREKMTAHSFEADTYSKIASGQLGELENLVNNPQNINTGTDSKGLGGEILEKVLGSKGKVQVDSKAALATFEKLIKLSEDAPKKLTEAVKGEKDKLEGMLNSKAEKEAIEEQRKEVTKATIAGKKAMAMVNTARAAARSLVASSMGSTEFSRKKEAEGVKKEGGLFADLA